MRPRAPSLSSILLRGLEQTARRLGGRGGRFSYRHNALHEALRRSKESIFKCHGKKGVSLRDNILLEPFAPDASLIKGKIHGTNFEDHHYQVQVEQSENLILTYSIW